MITEKRWSIVDIEYFIVNSQINCDIAVKMQLISNQINYNLNILFENLSLLINKNNIQVSYMSV